MQLQEKVNKCVKMIVVSIALLGGVILGGCGSQQAAPQPGLPEVAVVTVNPERVVLTTELPGRTSAYFVAEIRPQVNGIVQERLFNEGSDVKVGSVLYRIDPAPYQAAYDNAVAALARSEANLSPIRLKAERYRQLIALKAISQQDFDNADAALKQAEADIDYSKAAVESARINLAYTRITAPISGRIGKSNVTVGALATAYQGSPFATIQQLDPIYVDATQSSANLLQLKRNIAAGRIKGTGPDQARVKLLLEDGTPYPQEGILKFSEVTVDPSTGSFILRMVFPNPKHILLPGMYVRAIVQEGVVDRAILVPQQGVSRDPKGNPVALIVDGSGKVEQRMITVARAMGDRWLVSEGLNPGDRLIVEGSQKIRPGAPVKAVPFDGSRKDGGT
ncbi:MAG TPA: efflux RND transporter periplasmic adaptor subunit [Thermodesulfobacteriota bacterium]|jgi:membrane fusion protein (multidrug efflux system)|nr:efflux RND transporter periplasmic adaptor subunit [Thermodesulfobacteriota bacterium]